MPLYHRVFIVLLFYTDDDRRNNSHASDTVSEMIVEYQLYN